MRIWNPCGWLYGGCGLGLGVKVLRFRLRFSTSAGVGLGIGLDWIGLRFSLHAHVSWCVWHMGALAECDEYLFSTEYEYRILFGFQKSLNTKY